MIERPECKSSRGAIMIWSNFLLMGVDLAGANYLRGSAIIESGLK